MSIRSRLAPLLVALVASAAGCKKAAPPVAPEPVDDNASADVTDAAPLPAEVMQTLLENFRRVHFEVDSAILDEPSRVVLGDNAAILAEHPAVIVEIQGHADERGTTDYNLALGQKRADAVRSALQVAGVAPHRITTVSYGEERPAADGHSEVAWSQNRRVEFVVVAGDGVIGTTE